MVERILVKMRLYLFFSFYKVLVDDHALFPLSARRWYEMEKKCVHHAPLTITFSVLFSKHTRVKLKRHFSPKLESQQKTASREQPLLRQRKHAHDMSLWISMFFCASFLVCKCLDFFRENHSTGKREASPLKMTTKGRRKWEGKRVAAAAAETNQQALLPQTHTHEQQQNLTRDATYNIFFP